MLFILHLDFIFLVFLFICLFLFFFCLFFLFSFMFFFDWFFSVYFYSDFFYFIFVWCFIFVFVDSFSSYLRSFFVVSFIFVLDSLFTRYLLDDMFSDWDSFGCSKLNFFFFFALFNYFSFIFFQFTWLHFSVLFDLFNLFLFSWPLFFCYVCSFLLEYGFSFVTFIISNVWLRSWFVSDIFEWFSTWFSSFLRYFVGDLLFSRLISFSFFGCFHIFFYFYVFFITFIYVFYIPIACFTRYVSVFTALSVLWNVWVTSAFSVLTNCFGFFSSFVVLPFFFFFCILFLSFEACYVLIHIMLLCMLYVKIVSVVFLHKKSFSVGVFSNSFLRSYI